MQQITGHNTQSEKPTRHNQLHTESSQVQPNWQESHSMSPWQPSSIVTSSSSSCEASVPCSYGAAPDVFQAWNYMSSSPLVVAAGSEPCIFALALFPVLFLFLSQKCLQYSSYCLSSCSIAPFRSLSSHAPLEALRGLDSWLSTVPPLLDRTCPHWCWNLLRSQFSSSLP